MLPLGRLRAIYGAFGGGKSLRLVEVICNHYDEGYRLLLTNLHVTSDHAGFKGGKCPGDAAFSKRCPEMKVHWLTNAEMMTFWKHPEYRKGCVVAMDEAHLVYDSQGWKEEGKAAKDKGENLKGLWSQIRKERVQVWVVSQTLGDIVKFIRDRIKTAERRFGMAGWYCTRTWHFEGGVAVRPDKFGRMYPARRMRKWFPMYLTLARAGEVFDPEEPEAHFVPTKRGRFANVGRAVALLAAMLLLCVGMRFGVPWFWKMAIGHMWGAKPAPVAAVESVKDVPTSRPATRPAVPRGGPRQVSRPDVSAPVLYPVPEPLVKVVKGEYYAKSGAVVLAVKPDVVVVGDEHGGVHQVPRDDDSEYDLIREQRAGFRGSGETGATKGTASTAGGGASVGGSAIQGTVLPGRN